MRVRRSVQSAYLTGQENASGDHKQVITQLKQEIIKELKAELQSNFTALRNSASLTPMSTNRRPEKRSTNASSRRLFDRRMPLRTDQTNRPVRVDPTTLATGSAASPSLGMIVAQQPKPKFWLYLSRVAPTVTTEQIKALAANRLNTTDIDVYSLVGRDTDRRRLNFISFRIGMNEQLKEKAVSLTTWPAGLLVREFEQRRLAENFWEPVAEHGTLQNSSEMIVEGTPTRDNRTPLSALQA